jgi:hypothetical protein
MMARNLICVATDHPCSDGRCKVGYCIAEIEVRKLAGQAEVQLAERKIAARKAREARGRERATALIKQFGLTEALAIVDRIRQASKEKQP